MNTVANEPAILTVNTFYYKPGLSADNRRRNEKKYLGQVAAYFASLGLEVTTTGTEAHGKNEEVTASFSYSESCKNVYKSLSVYRKGKKSNITALRKLA